MNNKLVKWDGRNQQLLPFSEARAIMDRALGRSRESNALKAAAPRASIAHQKAGELIDLPRMCSVHDRPYVSRYIRNQSGRFR